MMILVILMIIIIILIERTGRWMAVPIGHLRLAAAAGTLR